MDTCCWRKSCREQCRLDRVWLLPAASAPHKQDRRTASARHRVEMLRLAVGGQAAIEVSTLEIDRGGVSYTVDTLAAIHAQEPSAELFLLMGADTLEDLPHWRAPGRICELAIPVVVRRAGSAEPRYELWQESFPPSRLELFRQFQVTMPIVELTSTEIRTPRGQRPEHPLPHSAGRREVHPDQRLYRPAYR